jgi:hypothetical protein
MYSILNFYAICFLKSILYAMNYEMIKSGMVKLTEKEKADVADAGVAMS